MEHDGGRLAFCETTDRMIEALGLRTGKQRLDSTHVMSNIAVLTRLGPKGRESTWSGAPHSIIRTTL